MKEIITVRTPGGNDYLYSLKKKQSILCHPLLAFLLEKFKPGLDYSELMAEFKGDSIRIENGETFSRQDLSYYWGKLKLLLDNGFLDPVDIKKQASLRLTADQVQLSLANCDCLVFEVTDTCNLRCEYCGFGKFYNDYDARKNQYLDFEVARRLVDHLLIYWNSSLNHSLNKQITIGFYGGEPLLNFPFIQKMVEYVKSLRLSRNFFGFNMTTNGILLKHYLNFLVYHDFSLTISLDGSEPENGYRIFPDQSSSQRQVVESVRRMREKYPFFFEKRVHFNSVLSNKNSVAGIHHFFKEKFQKTPTITEISPYGINPDYREEYLRAYKNFQESLYETEDYSLLEKDLSFQVPRIKDAIDFIHQYQNCVQRDYQGFFSDGNQGEFIPTGTCLPFNKKIFLTVNGKILPCERIGHQYALGQVGRDVVRLDFAVIAQKYNDYYNKLSRLCPTCYNLYNCRQCLFLLDIEKENVQCRGYMDVQRFKEYIKRQITFLEKNPQVRNMAMEEIHIS